MDAEDKRAKIDLASDSVLSPITLATYHPSGSISEGTCCLWEATEETRIPTKKRQLQSRLRADDNEVLREPQGGERSIVSVGR